MNVDPRQPWRDLLLRRELTPAEARDLAAWLARHPDAAADWALDTALSRALRALPDVPVASNFTAQVMSEVARERDPSRGLSAGLRGWLPWRWLPAAGGIALVAVIGFAAWQGLSTRRATEYARQVAALRAMSELPPSTLVDFDAIRRYGQSSAPVDLALLAALE